MKCKVDYNCKGGTDCCSQANCCEQKKCEQFYFFCRIFKFENKNVKKNQVADALAAEKRRRAVNQSEAEDVFGGVSSVDILNISYGGISSVGILLRMFHIFYPSFVQELVDPPS